MQSYPFCLDMSKHSLINAVAIPLCLCSGSVPRQYKPIPPFFSNKAQHPRGMTNPLDLEIAIIRIECLRIFKDNFVISALMSITPKDLQHVSIHRFRLSGSTGKMLTLCLSILGPNNSF